MMKSLTIKVLFPVLFAGVACCGITLAQNPDSGIFDDEPVLVLDNGAGEGPAYHPDYGVFVSGPDGISLLGKNQESSLFFANSGSNGLLIDQQGRLLICQQKMNRVSRMDLASRELTVLAGRYKGAKFNTPNDIGIDSKGRIYFSDPRYGPRDTMEIKDGNGKLVEGVYRIDPDGSVARVITHEVDRPNGVLVTPDDKFLFVADNHNNTVGAARKLWRFRLQSDGSVDLESKKLTMDWKTGRGPDGMAIDQRGRLYVAGGLNKPHLPHETADQFKGGVYVISPNGELLDFVPIPNDEVTNCSFAGDDLKTLYITAGGTLWSIRTKVKGVTTYSRPSVPVADADASALKKRVMDAAGGEANLMRLFRMKDQLKVGNNPDKPAKQRDAVLEPPAHWWIGKRDRVVVSNEPATYLVWAWTLGALTSSDSKLQVLPGIRDGDKGLVGLRISDSITPAMDMYFDEQTYQLTRIDWRADIHRFSDWKKFGAVTYPSKCLGFKKKAKNPWYRCEILELEVLDELPDGLERKLQKSN